MAKGGSHLRQDSQPPRRRAQADGECRRERKRPEPESRRRVSQAPEPESRRRVSQAPSAHAPPHRRKRRKGDGTLWIVIAVLALVIAFSLFMLARTVLGYVSNRSDYNEVQNAAIIPRLPETTPEAGEEVPVQSVESSEIPFEVDWNVLRETNSEIIAWLYCPDTVINYPVVQTSDNEKYLTVNFSGKSNAGGALFADYTSTVGIRASHLIIYGHNMKDESMFGTLKNYADEDYFKAHPVFYLLTPDRSYRVELLDCLTIDASLDNYPTYFSESGSLENYVGRLSSMAYWVNSEADWQNNQLVTMSTCTSSDDERLILQGVLVPIE